MTGLRRAALSDVGAIWALMAQFHSEDGDVLPKAHDSLKQLLQNPEIGQAYFIMNAGGQPVGYCLLCFGFNIESGGRDAFVDEFFVTSNHRNKGHGEIAIRLLAQEAEKLGVNRLFLEVDPDNQPAQKIYNRAGFMPRQNYQLMQLDLSANER